MSMYPDHDPYLAKHQIIAATDYARTERTRAKHRAEWADYVERAPRATLSDFPSMEELDTYEDDAPEQLQGRAANPSIRDAEDYTRERAAGREENAIQAERPSWRERAMFRPETMHHTYNPNHYAFS